MEVCIESNIFDGPMMTIYLDCLPILCWWACENMDIELSQAS